MAHRSRLAGFIIDCQDTDAGTAAHFWSAALGLAPRPPETDTDGAQYAGLAGAPGGLHVEVQRVDHAYLPDDLVAIGRDTETVALSKAVKFHIERRVFLNGSRTVIFR